MRLRRNKQVDPKKVACTDCGAVGTTTVGVLMPGGELVVPNDQEISDPEARYTLFCLVCGKRGG